MRIIIITIISLITISCLTLKIKKEYKIPNYENYTNYTDDYEINLSLIDDLFNKNKKEGKKMPWFEIVEIILQAIVTVIGAIWGGTKVANGVKAKFKK